VPKQQVSDRVRSLIYDKGSDVPWSKHAGYDIVQKRFIGISRRSFFDRGVMSQELKTRSDNVPPTQKKKGRKSNSKKILEIDLFHLSEKDLPKVIKKSIAGKDLDLDKQGNKQGYILSMVQPLTSLFWGKFLGFRKNSKSRLNTMKAVREGAKWFSEMLGVDEKSFRYHRDKGGEFSPISELPGLLRSLAPAVEAKNSHVQRVFHRMLKAKRGGIKEALSQAVKIVNNTKSRISKLTPIEAAKKTSKELAPRYNRARAHGNPDKFRTLSVSDKVFLVTKVPKSAGFYKSYQAKQYSKVLHKIERVGKTNPKRYFVNKKWRYRDQISAARVPIDTEAQKILDSRTQYGNKKAPKLKGPQVAQPKKKHIPQESIAARLKREKAKKKLLKTLSLGERLKSLKNKT
jgi:hypothetical protein